MVLGGQPPGRVGRRRSYLRAAPEGGSFFTRSRRVVLPDLESRERLSGQTLLRAGPIVQMVRGAGGQVRGPRLAIPPRLGVYPVLTKRREVDHQIGRIEQPLSYVYELSSH
jgi:hypothetical protein